MIKRLFFLVTLIAFMASPLYGEPAARTHRAATAVAARRKPVKIHADTPGPSRHVDSILRIATADYELILRTEPNGRLYQYYLGKRLADDNRRLVDTWRTVSHLRGEAYPGAGDADYFEPAVTITHNDGSFNTVLKVVGTERDVIDDNVTTTAVTLRDEAYGTCVKLFYTTYGRENVIVTRTQISHSEKKPVRLDSYASAMLYFNRASYYLTQFNGDWADEAGMHEQKLEFGKKVIDTKLGSRAALMVSPFFELGFDSPAAEDHGDVMVGTLGWTGNFRFTFEVDNHGILRLLPAINHVNSGYMLEPGTPFVTPEFIFTFSDEGMGRASRNMHDWARRYSLKDGEGDRMTLLNNWETTYFDFNEQKLGDLIKEAGELGVDMFLLDDGWFGNKYPRSRDNAGLGDWCVTADKLPGGISKLIEMAEETGVKFGLWIEPEMVNPKSELFEKHPDWAIMRPNHEPYYHRSQLVLDMSNPRVQDYVFGIVDGLLADNPGIAYFKWDCNSPITNIYSPWQGTRQGNLYIDHVRGVYNVLNRIRDKYPHLPMMLCSGGGGRCDYEALKYFTEFWCSDNTDPVERLFIQWGFSQLFPAKAMCAHVTSWRGDTSVKFRTDVAMSCKMGFDIRLASLSERDRLFCRQAIADYNRIKSTILDGDLYRLVSPYGSDHTAVSYVDKDKARAVVFAYDIYPRFGDKRRPVQLKGLDPKADYMVGEISLMPGSRSSLSFDGKIFSGDYLMKNGLDIFTSGRLKSRVIELKAVGQ